MLFLSPVICRDIYGEVIQFQGLGDVLLYESEVFAFLCLGILTDIGIVSLAEGDTGFCSYLIERLALLIEGMHIVVAQLVIVYLLATDHK